MRLQVRPWLLWVCCAAVLVAPLFLAAIPPLTDYPNHLARAYVLADGAQDPTLAQIYAARWRVIPNLALDLVMAPLLRILPLYMAGRVVLAGALLLPMLAVALYNRALFRRVTVWPLVSALVAYNGAFLLGLVNFLFAVSAAFATAALWIAWRERAPRITVIMAALGAVVVFFCHLTGLPVLLVLIGAYECDRWLVVNEGPVELVRTRVMPMIGVFLPCVVLYRLSPTAAASGATERISWLVKPYLLLASVINYGVFLDVVSGCFLLLLLGVALKQGWLIMPRVTRIAVATMAALVLLAPFRVKGGAYLDFRFAVVLALILIAGIGQTAALGRRAPAVLLCVVGLFAIRYAVLVGAWRHQDADLAAIRQAVQAVPAASRVLIVTADQADAPDYWAGAPRNRTLGGIVPANEHMAAVALIERKAFFQTFFADPTQQPVAVLPPYRASASPTASWGAPSYSALGQADLGPWLRAAHPYLVGWWKRFDYVLVLNAEAVPSGDKFLPRCLVPVSATGLAAVYRIQATDNVRSGADCAAAG